MVHDMKKDFILTIYKDSKTVFTFKDISLLLEESDMKSLKAKIYYHVKRGALKAVRRGVYVKSNYNTYELATSIYSPAYISLETVLKDEGIIFQHYGSVFTVSYISRKIKVDGNDIVMRKIKDEILYNSDGIRNNQNYSIATKARAFLDALYLYKDYHFDNLDGLDKEEVFRLADIYQSKTLIRKITKVLR